MATAEPMDQAELLELLDTALPRSGGAGLIAGRSDGSDVLTAAAGVANLNTGLLMSPDTLFLTGSITKVWTTSLAMTFVDDGTLELERPVRSYLPEFRVADSEVTKHVTPWHLLNHSSGWDAGDLIVQLGEGPEAHQRFVERLATVGQVHELGAYASYNNAGWVVLAAILERLTDRDLRDLFAERLFRPLGLTKTCLSADDAIVHSTAVGAVRDLVTGELKAARLMFLPKTFAGAGATLFVTAADTLRFFRMHLHAGVADDGTRVVSEASVRAMATPTMRFGPPGVRGPEISAGLGWGITHREGRTLLSHTGGSVGGLASGGVVPDRDLAYIVYSNGGDTGPVERRLQETVLPRPATPPAAEPPHGDADHDAERFIGSYSRASTRFEVYRDTAGVLQMSTRLVPEEVQGVDAPGVGQAWPIPAFVVSPSELAAGSPEGLRTEFFELDEENRFRLLWSSGRLARRVNQPPAG